MIAIELLVVEILGDLDGFSMIYTKWQQYHAPFHLLIWGYGYADPKYMTIVAAIMNSIQRSII